MMTARDLTVACEAVDAQAGEHTSLYPGRRRLRVQAERLGMDYQQLIDASRERTDDLLRALRQMGVGLSGNGEAVVAMLLGVAWTDGLETGLAYRRVGGELREPEHSARARMARMLRGTL